MNVLSERKLFTCRGLTVLYKRPHVKWFSSDKIKTHTLNNINKRTVREVSQSVSWVAIAGYWIRGYRIAHTFTVPVKSFLAITPGRLLRNLHPGALGEPPWSLLLSFQKISCLHTEQACNPLILVLILSDWYCCDDHYYY